MASLPDRSGADCGGDVLWGRGSQLRIGRQQQQQQQDTLTC
jgi:hypothetical protein